MEWSRHAEQERCRRRLAVGDAVQSAQCGWGDGARWVDMSQRGVGILPMELLQDFK